MSSPYSSYFRLVSVKSFFWFMHVFLHLFLLMQRQLSILLVTKSKGWAGLAFTEGKKGQLLAGYPQGVLSVLSASHPCHVLK